MLRLAEHAQYRVGKRGLNILTTPSPTENSGPGRILLALMLTAG